MTSIKENIILNCINTISGILFPVITFPYAARVLLPEGIGVINFLNSIIAYILLLTSLGIPMYAVKEVARFRDNIEVRDKITCEIIALSITLCFCGYIIVWILAKYVPRIHEQATLFYILSLSIIFNSIGVNWFYQGIEDFKFITIRAIIIRFLSAISLFVFVKNSSDILIYGIINVGSTVGNNIINFVHLGQLLHLKGISFKSLSICRHIGPTMKLFALSVISGIYLQLNSIMLGFISGDEEVGFYTAGTRITHIGLMVISSMGTVLLPRCSHLIQRGDMENFNRIIRKSLNLTLLLSLPLSIGIILLAPVIVNIFCGIGYEKAIMVVCLNAPVIIMISLSSVTGIQVLYPLGKLKLIIVSISGGALTNIVVNTILIPLCGAAGASFASLIAEVAVLVLQLYLGKRFMPFEIKDLFNYKYILASFIMGVIIEIISLGVNGDLMKLILGSLCGVMVYMIILIVLKDRMIKDILKIIPFKLK